MMQPPGASSASHLSQLIRSLRTLHHGIALQLQRRCQLLAAGLDDLAVDHDVHEVGRNVVQQPLQASGGGAGAYECTPRAFGRSPKKRDACAALRSACACARGKRTGAAASLFPAVHSTSSGTEATRGCNLAQRIFASLRRRR